MTPFINRDIISERLASMFDCRSKCFLKNKRPKKCILRFSFLLLSKEQSDMEGISDSLLQPSSNHLLADVGLQLSNTFGPLTEFAASMKKRRSKESSQKPVFNEEKYAFPVRPLRRKDSSASRCKENSDASLQCSTVNFPDGLFKQSPAAEISKEDVQPHLVKKELVLSSTLPIPKPRMKKHPSGLIIDDDVNHDVPAACLPSDQEQDGQLVLPVPLPRAKKHLGASYSGSTQKECESLAQQNEASKETTEDSVSLDPAVISGGCATIQGGGDSLSEVEREVLAAMAEEEVTDNDSREEPKDELLEGWTFADQCGVIDHLEQDGISAMSGVEKDLDAYMAVDDWLCISSDKDVELQSNEQVKCEEVDFGFVSIDVAAGSVQDER